MDPRGRTQLLRDLAPRWLATKQGKAQSTIDGYEGLLRTRVLPRFGDHHIGGITPEVIASWIGDLHQEGLSPSRIRQARLVLQGTLELAVSARELGSNPCRDRLVRTAEPKIPRKTLRREDVPTEDEVAAMIGSAHERWRGLLMVMAYGGLRFGEAAGLAPEDVVVGGVYVRRAVSETSRGLLLGPVKDHEERFVELPRYVQRVLLLLAEHADGEVLFATRRGGLLSVSSFHHQVWKPTLRDAGVPHRRIKALRAFAASLWLDAGASIEFVRHQLGHADLRTTQKYLETFSSRRESIMNRLNDRFDSRSDVGLVWGSKGVAAGGE